MKRAGWGEKRKGRGRGNRRGRGKWTVRGRGMDGGEGRDGARGRIEKMKERLDEEDGKRMGRGRDG